LKWADAKQAIFLCGLTERKAMQLLPRPGVKGQSHAGDRYIKHVRLIEYLRVNMEVIFNKA
jgi:hypothetical protein